MYLNYPNGNRSISTRKVQAMAKHHDTLYRQWQLLRQIPRHPQKIAVKALHGYLAAEGQEISERTLQRDLNDLSLVFPLIVDDREKPYGWSWKKDAKNFDLPGLTTTEALTLVLAERHLSQMLPTSTLDHLRPHFKAAHERLDAEPKPQRGRSWLNKVRTVPPMQPLIPPQIDPEVHRAVSDALLHEQQLEIRYRTKGNSQAAVYKLHPLALIQRGCILYLYARVFDYPNARNLALHRVEHVNILEEAAIPPDGFDLDNKIEMGVWGFGAGEQIAIKLRFYDGTGEHLRETPLSRDQQVEAVPEQAGVLNIRATVADTPQLKWWLLGFGDGVEVLAPEVLRRSLSETVGKMVGRYAPMAPDN